MAGRISREPGCLHKQDCQAKGARLCWSCANKLSLSRPSVREKLSASVKRYVAEHPEEKARWVQNRQASIANRDSPQ